MVACVAAVSFPFILQTESEQAGEKAGEGPGVSKNLGRSGEGVSEEGEGVERKGNACNQSQTFYQNPFAHERGAIVQLDWLVARRSKSDIKNLTFMHKRHPEYKTTNKIKNIGRVRGSFRIFSSGKKKRSFEKW